jgi:hypothetical protein
MLMHLVHKVKRCFIEGYITLLNLWELTCLPCKNSAVLKLWQQGGCGLKMSQSAIEEKEEEEMFFKLKLPCCNAMTSILVS